MALETAFNIEVGIIILQEPFISNWELFCNTFNFYWLQGDRIAIRVMTTIKKDLFSKIIAEYMTDLVNHPIFTLLEI